MKLAFYGSSLLSAYWNGAATYYRGMLGELARRGYAITFYEPDAFERQSHRDIEPPDWARVVVYPATEAAARRVSALAPAADGEGRPPAACDPDLLGRAGAGHAGRTAARPGPAAAPAAADARHGADLW